ncbi:MAG TPA: NAD(+) diphosphatase [Azospirillaceae bacterium]|nr:NAD(+) diphosphatase [Azospirillaceae bacterium]
MSKGNAYTGATIDRASEYRKNGDWLAERLAGGRITAFWRGKHLVTGPREAPVPALLPPDAGWWRDHAPHGPAFLGLEGGEAWFAVDLSSIEEPEAHPELTALGALVDLRTLSPALDPATAGLFAYARGLLHWQDRHRFCGVCGHPARVEEGGHVRRCTNAACATAHFPRTDPAVIVLIHDGGDRCLLGRQPRFPPGWYSTLAGFVEPGESLEQAVAREMREESGLEVTDVRYHSSQPWPFPASLMLGFHARANGGTLRVDGEELEDARWFDRAFLLAHEPSETFRLPPRDSISRRLIEDWMHGRV